MFYSKHYRIKISAFVLCCLFALASNAQTCRLESEIPSTVPDSQFVDNGDGTVSDTKSLLMWKKCIEGLSGANCGNGGLSLLNWTGALQQVQTINTGGGFAGFADWRLPNSKELESLVEERCYSLTINSTYFPATTTSFVWSSSPYARGTGMAWGVSFLSGHAHVDPMMNNHVVRLVRTED